MGVFVQTKWNSQGSYFSWALSSRCLVAEGTVVEESRGEHQEAAAQADLLLVLRLEEAPALLLEEALTVQVPDTARLMAPDTAHLTALALALPLTEQDIVLPQAQFSSRQKQHLQEKVVMEAGAIEGLQVQESMVCNNKDLVHISPSPRLSQVPGAVRAESKLH